MPSAKDFHAQINTMMSGNQSATSTTSFVSVIEGLASDTRQMLYNQTKHFSIIEKLLGKGKFGQDTGKGLMDSIFGALFKGKNAGQVIASALGLTAAGTWLKTRVMNMGRTIRTGTVNAVRLFAERVTGTIKTAFNAGSAVLEKRLSSMVKTSFSVMERAVPRTISTVSQITRSASRFSASMARYAGSGAETLGKYGKRIGSALENAFAWMKGTKAVETLSMFERVGKLGATVASFGTKIKGFSPLLAKLNAAATAAFAGWDAYSAFTDTDKFLTKTTKHDDFITKYYTKTMAAVHNVENGLLLGAPDWIAGKMGYKSFADMGDYRDLKNDKSMLKIGARVHELINGGKPSTIIKGKDLPKIDNDMVKQSLHPTAGLFDAPFDSKKIVKKSVDTNNSTLQMNNGVNSMNSVSSAVIAQLPSAMTQAVWDMRDRMIQGVADMVKTYAELQADALKQQKEDTDAAQKDAARQSRGLLGRIASYAGAISNDSGLNSLRSSDSPYSMNTPNSPNSYTPNNQDAVNQSKIAAPKNEFGKRNADNSWTVGDKQYAADSPQAHKYTAMDEVAKMKYAPPASEWKDSLGEKEKVGLLKRDIGKRMPDLEPNQLSGMVANLKGEGKLNANQHEIGLPPNKGGIGHMQWTGPRRRLLEAYAASKGKPWTDNDTQLDFMKEEREGRQGTEKAAYDRWIAESKGKSPAESAALFEKYVERPGVLSTRSRMDKANEYANIEPAREQTNTQLDPKFKTKDGMFGPGLAGIVKSSTMDKVMDARSVDTNPAASTRNENIPVNVRQDQAGHTRDKPVQQQVLSSVQEAVYRSLGEGFTASVYSGGQDKNGKRKGTRRHDEGGAADLKIYDKNGNQVTQEQYAKVAQLYMAENMGSVGMQMNGGGVHFDKFKRDQKPGSADALKPEEAQTWTYDREGGEKLTDATRKAMTEGVRGVLPDGVMSKKDFLAKISKSPATPTATNAVRPEGTDLLRNIDVPSYSALANTAKVAKPTSVLANPTIDSWPGHDPRVTPAVPKQLQAVGNSAGNLQKKTQEDRQASSTPDNKVRVSDIAPIDEWKMTLANGSALV